MTATPGHDDEPSSSPARPIRRVTAAARTSPGGRPAEPTGPTASGTAGASGRPIPHTMVLALQASAGNAAVTRLVGPPHADHHARAPNRTNPAAQLTSTEAVQRLPGPTAEPDLRLIVDDSAPAAAGQMTKSQFLAALRTAVTGTANDALAPVGRTAADCPYIEKAFARYAGQNADQVETALRRYAPDAASAHSARDYLAPVSAQVRSGIGRWVASGGPDLREDSPAGLTAGLSALGGMAGTAMSAVGRLLFKARPGGARSADPAAIRSGLGPGRPMDGTTRVRMESALGSDFGDVRLHDDPAAAATAAGLNARAFAVGSDIAFDSGGYRPGSPAGDALLAHELAHVMQQGSDPAAVHAKGHDHDGDEHGGSDQGDDHAEDDSSLEPAADTAAARAVLKLWGSARDTGSDIAGRAVPTARSGLRLQRCSGLSSSREKSWLDQAHARAGGDLDTQAKTAQGEMLALEGIANQIRATASAKGLVPADVMAPWDEAFRAVVAMQPEQLKSGTLDEELKNRAAAAMERFYANFRKLVAPRDYVQRSKSRSGIDLTKNPYLTQGALEGDRYPIFDADHEGILKRLRGAKSAADWSTVVADFRTVAHAMDRYIADQLRMDAKKEEGKTLAGKETQAGDAVAKLEASLGGSLDPTVVDAAKTAMGAFASTLRETVAHADYMTKYTPKAVKSTPPSMIRTNDFLTQEDLETFKFRLGRAESAGDLRTVIAEYRKLGQARDRYLADDKVPGSSADADKLVQAGGVSRGIDQLRETHPEAQKVRTIFYPEPSEKEVDQPDYKAAAIPIELFLFQDGDTWKLKDLTTPLEPKENKAKAEPGKPPPLKDLYEQLDSKLRFPRGLLTYRAADGTSGEQRTYAERELSDWLSMIGLTLAAVGMALATAGASMAATGFIITASLAGAGAALAAMSEKSEQGMLTNVDIAVGVSTIVSEVMAGLTAGMGKLIVAGAGKTGNLARMAVLADRFYIPTTKFMMGTNVVSFITVSVQGAQELQKVENSGASEPEKTIARERLAQQMLLLGSITMLGMKGDIATFKSGRNLYFDLDFAEGGMARAMLKNDELLAGAKRLGAASELEVLLKRKDLPEEVGHRLNAELSDALNHARIPDDSLRRVMNRLPGNATVPQLEAALADLRKANRLVHAGVLGDHGKIIIDEFAGKLRVRMLLSDEDLFKRGKALGTDTNLEVALARKDFDEDLRNEIRREISTAMATGQIDNDGLRKVIGGLKKASGATQARETLAELLHGNRIAEAGMAPGGKVILGASAGVEYSVGPKKLTIDPVADADALYPGADGMAHLEEVKNTVGALRQKLGEKPQQLENMRKWAAQDPAARRIGIVIESENQWTDIIRPIKGGKEAALKQLSTSGVPLRIAGRDLSAEQLDALWDAIEAKAKSMKMYPPPPKFFDNMPTLADAEKFLGIKL